MIDDVDGFDGEGTIEDVIVTKSGPVRIEFEEGHHVLIESGSCGVETLERAFGSIEEAVGKRIVYATDASNVLMYFGVLGCDCDMCRGQYERNPERGHDELRSVPRSRSLLRRGLPDGLRFDRVRPKRRGNLPQP